MGIVINTNTAVTVASGSLAGSHGLLRRSLRPLSSGSRMVDSLGDAGGPAVAMRLSARLRSLGATHTNITNAMSHLQAQEGALRTVTEILTRIGELKMLALDVTKSPDDRASYNVEYVQLQAALNSLVFEQFNGDSLFRTDSLNVFTSSEADPSSAVVLEGVNLLGAAAGTSTSTTTGPTHDAAAEDGIAGSISGSLGAIVSTGSLDSLGQTTVTAALQDVSTCRARNGASRNQLNMVREMVSTNEAGLEVASSRITDIDVAAEVTRLARARILSQGGTAVLAHANVIPQKVVRLLAA